MTNTTIKINTLLEKFNNQFMKPDIRTQLTVSEISNEYGELRFAEQGDENLDDNESITDTYTDVSLCRLSASGYLDCTEYTLCHDEDDILQWLETEVIEIEDNEPLDDEYFSTYR